MALYDGSNAPTVTVEIDVSKVGAFVIGASIIGGTDTIASGSIVWGTLTSTDIRSVSIRRGRTREDQAVQPGSLSLVLDNRSGKYDPDNAASPYYVGAFSILNRGLGVRVSATWSGNTYVIYRGYLEQIDVDQSLDPVAIIQFTDALAYIATQTVPAIASSYSGDTTATRLGRILDAIGWDASLRSISGTRQMQPTTFGDTALALGDQVSRCEFGRFYADRQGKITLLPYESTFSTPSRLAFSDTRASGTVEYDTIVTAPGAKYLINSVALQQTVSTSQTYIDTTSQAIYGTYSKIYDTPLLDNAVTLALATLITNRYSLPKTRVDRVEFDAIGIESASWVQLLQSDLGDNMTVTRTTVDGRTRTFTSLVESISIDLTPYNWRVGMDLSPAAGVAYFTIGTSLIGGFDILTN